MSKVLVFCSDMVPLPGLPTSGGGLRSWQIVEGLRGRGLDVVFSMPRNRFLRREFDERVPQEDRERLWTDSNQDRIIADEKPDVIVCAGPSTRKWSVDHQIPVALDFAGPHLMEFEQMANFYLPAARFTRVTSKIQTISMADFFTCAGARQRYYFMAFLMMAGVDFAHLEIHYMPLAVPSTIPARQPDTADRAVIFSGGFYPWLDPMPGLRQLARTLDEIKIGRLESTAEAIKRTQRKAPCSISSNGK